MPSKKDNIMEFNQYMNSDKMSYIIYADMESLIKKINVQTIQKILEEQNSCGYSLWIGNVNNLGI